MSHESHPVLLSRADIEWQIFRGLQQIRASVWNDALSRNPMRNDRAQAAMVRILTDRFKDLEVYKRPPDPHPVSPPPWTPPE